MNHPPHVLLVDDNPADVTLTRVASEECRHGAEISNVWDGEQALAFLHQIAPWIGAARPDLVILDLNLPGKDGRSVLAEMKADPGLRSIPVVVFSTSHARQDIERSYELGANCYVSKPGNLADFMAAVSSIEDFWFGSAHLPEGRT